MKINMCLSLISHASINIPMELNFVRIIRSFVYWLMIFWSKVVLAPTQGLGGIYFENKNHGNSLMLKHHQRHIYMRVVLMVPHSYLVHFELVQSYCLSSYAMHIPYFDHTRTRHQSLSIMVNHTKGSSSPWNKKKTSKVSHHTHGSLFALKKKEGKMIRAKV